MTTTSPVKPATSRQPGKARSPWAVLAVLCLGLFMILLDGTIVNIAIPHIQSYYDTTYSNIEWVMNAYILAFAVLLVPMGRFGDLWGRRKLFLAGMVLFTLGSLACGLAPSIYLLIAFRVVQGIGGRPLMGFNQVGIHVLKGVGDDVRTTVDAFLTGGLPEFGMEHACQH